MKRKTVKLFTVLLCAVLLIGAIPMNAFAFSVDPKVQVQHAEGGTSSYSSLTSAVNAAVDGDTVTLAGEVSSLSVSGGMTVNKNITFKTGKDFNGNKKYIEYTGTNAPLFTVENGGVLTVTDAQIFGKTNASLLSGGCFYVKKGGTLVLDGKAGAEVLLKNFKLTAQNTKGGAVYCEQGGKVIVNGVSFADNFAANGADIYAEQKTDVTLDEGVTVNADYGESVDINGLNLVLTGEIGLVFHTAVPEKYLDGSFVLTCRTSDTVTYKISECGKDSDGRYLAKYNLSSIELSEPVTLTVCDKDGNVITSKTKSAEEYGNVILNGNEATTEEKNVVRTLLNYGHFAQIECADYNGWEIGKDYAETSQYGDLTTDKSVFDEYKANWTKHDASLTKIGVQLCLGYKTDILLHFPVTDKPTVTVNGEETEVEESTITDYNYRICIKAISALDLEEKFTVEVNGNTSITLSALSYCKLAVEQGSEKSINAVKALYEFFKATAEYNK